MLFYGWRKYGRLNVEGGLTVVTMFFHLFWLPLVPYRGLIMVNKDQGLKSRLRIRSVIVGYGKVWGPVLLFVAFVLGANFGSDPSAIVWTVVAGLVGTVLTSVGYVPRFSTLDGDRSAEIHEELRNLASPKSSPAPGTER